MTSVARRPVRPGGRPALDETGRRRRRCRRTKMTSASRAARWATCGVGHPGAAPMVRLAPLNRRKTGGSPGTRVPRIPGRCPPRVLFLPQLQVFASFLVDLHRQLGLALVFFRRQPARCGCSPWRRRLRRRQGGLGLAVVVLAAGRRSSIRGLDQAVRGQRSRCLRR